jgi:peptidoglycan-associated lipoprotein
MIKHALWFFSILVIVAWLGGCAQEGATAQAPTAQPAAQPQQPQQQPAAQPQPEAKPEEPKPAMKPEPEPVKDPTTGGAATVITSSGLELRIVYFDFDKYDIKPEFRDDIKTNAAELNKDRSVKVTIEGHCDERGSTEYNLALGERRATAVQKALIAEGVAANRLKVVSYGEERPVDPGHDEGAWGKNRRSVLSQ